MITSVLVANRGESACRIVRTCRRLGVRTVAVHADPDAHAAHVRQADAAVRLPGTAPADTYLRGDLLVAAALAAGADAVHPGWGFLSENAPFARAVQEAGLTWIGPPPDAIETMASKTRARALLGAPELTDVTAADLPVMVKAAAGGGGRGMRVVHELGELPEALASAREEARRSFGDGEVFVEPYVEHGRHVEVQVLADAHGTVWALGTRDCSLQRRHQKVVEESPAPGLPARVGDEIAAAALEITRKAGYRGAGTVEFLVTPDGRWQFLEMNTRLQVEHPVTEEVFGIDLVALQIAVAEGAPLPPAPPGPRGHAVEVRLCAEDPGAGWAPSTGLLHAFDLDTGPAAQAGAGAADTPRLRVDAGYASGDTVGVHYDSLLAKVVAWAPTRGAAVRRLADALRRARLHGPATNRDLLVRSLLHPEFAAARHDTGFYGRHLDALTAPAPGERYAAVAAALADAAARQHAAAGPGGRLGAWRNLVSGPQCKTYGCHEVRYLRTRGGWALPDDPDVRVLGAAPGTARLEIAGVAHDIEVAEHDGTAHVDGPLGSYRLVRLPRLPEPAAHTAPGSLLAPMPGTVVRVAEGLAEGAPVTAGQPLLWLEAMKMEHRVTAPASGVLAALHAAPGLTVEAGALLAVVKGEKPRPPAAPMHEAPRSSAASTHKEPS